jgi:hypothetical protein
VRDKRARGGFAAEYKGGYCVVESQKSQKIKIIKTIIIWRAPRPCGACPTQPYKCGQNVKVKVKTPQKRLKRLFERSLRRF